MKAYWTFWYVVGCQSHGPLQEVWGYIGLGQRGCLDYKPFKSVYGGSKGLGVVKIVVLLKVLHRLGV